jgi:two-component system, OmpR family, phosphate regulon response regulator PhoB
MEQRNQRILVIDDEQDVTELVAYNLRTRRFEVQTMNDPTSCLSVAHTFAPDLVILDVMMPHLSGIQVCRIFRADIKLVNIPIIFLTAKGEETDRIQGFEAGADDYICKPFSIKELILRIESVLRRAKYQTGTPIKKLQIGSISIDSEIHQATVQGKTIELTATEFKLLRLLMERQGRVQTREHLLVNVWNYSTEIETRTVDTHIRRLREKLGAEAAWIETLRGVGYRIAEKKPAPA